MGGDVFQVARGWRDNDLFMGEPYSRGEAWLWLIEHACWKPTRTKIKGVIVELKRGQLSFASRFLAEKWSWSKSKVDRFFDALRSDGMIVTGPSTGPSDGPSIGKGASVITIVNYDVYQFPPRQKGEQTEPSNEPSSEPSAGHQRAKEEEGKDILEPKGSSATADGEGEQEDAPEAPAPKRDIAGAFDEWCGLAKGHGWRVPKGLTDDRRKKLALRIDEQGREGWTEALGKAAASSYLHKPECRNWFDFDWLVKNQQHIVKVLEGKYDDRGAPEGGYVPSGARTAAELEASRRQLIEQGVLPAAA